MIAYQIAELSPDAPGGFAPRGAVRELWTSRDPETIIAGPAECVAGETRLYNPLSGMGLPIRAYATLGKAPIVLTEHGPIQAEVPFLKGRAALYRVTLTTGESFVATARHLVLAAQGWTFVEDLAYGDAVPSSRPNPPRSSWAAALSGTRPDARRSSRIDADSRCNCPACLLVRDAPPLVVASSARDVPPSRADARGHSRDDRGSDGPGASAAHSRLCPRCGHLASDHCQDRRCDEACRESDSLVGTLALVSCSSRLGGQSPRGSDLPLPTRGPVDLAARNVTPCVTSCEYYTTVPYSAVSSIAYERTDDYYDLTVPGAAHYFAQGVWHHNTGKTYGCLHWLDALAWKYPGMQAAVVRKTYNSAIASVVQTYERKVLGAGSPVHPYGGDHPQWYDYPNGSRVWVGGMDNPGKVLSSERDIIYANQAEELTLDDWETLRTRATGRAGNMPYARSVGDCNPGPPQHWILQREQAGRLRVLHSRHEDNPALFDTGGLLTAQGRATMAVLDSLTGVRYQRLRRGLWVSAEGTVYELADAHLGDNLFQPDKPTQLAVDPSNGSGPYAALVLQQVGTRVLVVGEFYQVGGMDEDLRDWLLASPYLAKLTKVVCDPAKADTIKRLRSMLKVHVQAKEGRKDITAQINAVKSLMVVDPVTKVAPLVIDRGRCPMLLDEFSQYKWKTPAGGRPVRTARVRNAHTDEWESVPIYDDTPEDEHNHCLDALAYWVTTRALLGSREAVGREHVKPAIPWYAQPSGVRR